MSEQIWEQLNLTEIDRLVKKLLYQNDIGFKDVAESLMEGNFEQAFSRLWEAFLNVCLPGVSESRSLFAGILLLGLFATLLQYTFKMVKNRQVAELAYYFVYLLAVLLLINSFDEILQVGDQTLQECREFISVLAPAYCLSISMSIGSISAAANYEFILLLLLGTDYILGGLLLPLTQGYVFLAVMDGLDEKHRMKELIKLADKIISWGIRLCLMVALMVSGVQNLVAPKIDGVQKTVVQKVVGSIPGIGDMSESVTDIVMGATGLIKNTIGATAMICMLLLLLRPMWKVFCVAMTMKVAAACMRIMGQNRLSEVVTRVGDGGVQVMKITMCVTLVFFISVAMTMMATKG